VTHLDASQAYHDFADALDRVTLGKERIVLQRDGRDVAALIPIEDLSQLETDEDKADVAAATVAEAEAAANGQSPIPWREGREQLGL
jgi:antitoxin (DNA-binding transcriptional repressor) of toxin-antitoxin stability system